MMKKIITGFCMSVLVFGWMCPVQSQAQNFKVGDNVIAFGVGLGSTYGYATSSSTPALSAQYEHGNWAVGGPGTISLGGFLAYKGYSYESYYYTQTWSYTILGFRSAYHFNGLQAPKFDPYGGLMLSYDIASSSYTSKDHNYDYLYSGGYGSAIRLTLFLGGRYYFSEKWGAYAELGFGNAILTLGAVCKF
jgi:hypothetical protein